MVGGIPGLFRKVGTAALVLGIFLGVGFVIQGIFPSVAFAATAPEATYSGAFVAFVGNIIASIVNYIGDAVGSLTLVIIEVVVVNVLNYNNFSSSNIVTLGWTLTRDMVNMGVVIILLILAVKTMLGNLGASWQQHLPKFFLGIVAVNFSRTICGLAIDASQIVMMTFVNALMSIAAGNFAQLMVMPQASSYSVDTFQAASEVAGGTTQLISLASNIANAYVKLLVQVSVMVVILLLAIAFIWRIIILWILLIMSPLAFFSWGAMDIVKFFGNVWGEWLSQFVAALVLGPMLSFFLYLALAASSNGNLAKTEAFPEPEKRTTYGQITLQVFESTNFTGLLIAIVFLLLGIRESAKTASKLGGLASWAINEKMGKRALSFGRTVSGKALGAPVSALRAASGSLARSDFAASRPNLQKFSRGVNRISQVAESPLESAGRATLFTAKKTGKALTAAGAATGFDSLMKAGSAVDAKLHGIEEGGLDTIIPGVSAVLGAGGTKAAKDRISHMTMEQKTERLVKSMRGDSERTSELDSDAHVLTGEVFKNKEFAKKFKESLGDNEADQEKNFANFMGHQLAHFADDFDHSPLSKEEFIKARSQYIDAFADADQQKAKEFIASNDFDPKVIRKGAEKNPAVILALASSATGEKKNGRFTTKLDLLNDVQQKAAQRAAPAVIKSITEQMFVQKVGGKPGESEAGGTLDDNIRAISRLDNLKDLPLGVRDKVAAQLKAIEASGRTNNFADDELAVIRKHVVDANASGAYKAAFAATGSTPTAFTASLAEGKRAMDDSFGGSTYSAATPAVPLRDRKKFKSLVTEDPSAMRFVEDKALATADSDVVKTTFDALSKESFEKMKDMVGTGARTRDEVKEALKKIEMVLNAQEEKARKGVKQSDIDAALKDIKDAADNLKQATTDVARNLEQANLNAARAKHEAVVASMDKPAIDKIENLRSSWKATDRYI